MASNTPIVRQVAWISLIPQFMFLGLLIGIYVLLGLNEPVFKGALTYLIISISTRYLVAKNHRRGIRLVKLQQFENAIPEFEKSVDFFTKNSWIDRYRYLTLLSSSKMTYKEMGLCNIAFCYSQTHQGEKAKKYYELVLQEFPNNGLAIAGLNMINSFDPPKHGDNP